LSLISRERAVFGVVGVVVLIASLTHAGGQAVAGEVYLDARVPSERRVEDLLRRMTLEEKIGQMAQIRVGKLRGDCNWANGPLVDSCLKAVLADAHVGSILSGGGDAPPENTPRAWAEMNNAIQRYALEHSRLKIPVIYGSDGVHGHNNVISATMFPHQIGLGATWNPGLQEQIGVSASKALRATGVFWNFAPVSDIARDTRWGRYYETYSEDPFLAGQLAAANVRGQQARVEDTAQLAATAKHFAGYSAPANGHDRGAAQIPVRQLQDVVLPPFQAQFDAGVSTVMINSGSLNGVPVHASKYMLQTQLRDRMGFQGVAVSDWQDMRYLADLHKVAPDYKTAIAMSVNAGVDMAMEPSNAAEFTSLLLANVRDGSVSRGRVDQAVRRVLKLKFDLGLFEKPYVDPAKADGNVVDVDRSLARQAAAESTVLLKNDGVLPLSTTAKKIVVTGETADDVRRQLGGWTVGWQGVPDGSPLPPTATVLTGVREAVPGASVVHATTPAAAAADAADADAVVVVLGEKPGAEGPADTENPVLTPEQQAWVDAVQATGKPVVVVLLTARPQVLGAAADANALVAGWLPGSEGGRGIADVLFGAVNPSGRLPISWPKALGDPTLTYDQLPGANPAADAKYDPLYAFGHGLSYTSFATSGVTAETSRGNGVVRFTVANTGGRAGTAIVPVYVRQPASPVLTPDQRLVGFTRVELAPGQSKQVEVPFALSQLALTVGDVDGSGRREVARGAYEAVVGADKAGFTVR
jgi:beta-glucosidase